MATRSPVTVARAVACIVACTVATACAQSGEPAARSTPGSSSTARIVLVGDIMLGRGVAPVVSWDPSSIFEQLRPVLVDADLALGNLESPLTRRAHLTGDYALEADPAAAELLAGAGFDVMGIANNHATDAGPQTVLDTIGALGEAGVLGVGGGADAEDAAAPVVVELDGIRVGIIAFSASGGEAATATAPGVNTWDTERARIAVRELRERADVVVVGLHAGIEYLTRPDPVLEHLVDLLAEWGVDVVWGHGAHVRYPVDIVQEPGGPSMVAPGLGNALFDQRWPRTRVGTVLEVLVDRDGVVASRTGTVRSDAGRAVFDSWDEPDGDAVALDGDWWTPVRAGSSAERAAGHRSAESPITDTIAVAAGDVTGAGEIDTVVAYQRAATAHPIHDRFPELDWFGADGRTAHIAVFTGDGRMRWGAATVLQPIAEIAVCTGSMALGFTTLDALDATDPPVTAAGAWIWDGFGFRTAPVLAGDAVVGCVDIDLDGRLDPVVLRATGASTPA